MPEPMTYPCPTCGAEVRVGGECPGCPKRKPGRRRARPNRRHRSWQQDASHDGLDLADEDFDYDEFVAREFGTVPHRKLGVKWYWWLLGIVVLILLAIEAFHLGRGS